MKRHPDPSRLALLTEREREVLALLGQGLTNVEIGAELYLDEVEERTVSAHVMNMMEKLRVDSRLQLAAYAPLLMLTQEEEELRNLIARGLSTRGIAKAMGLEPAEVRAKSESLRRKLIGRDF